jgi:hypothetical protein
LRIGGGVGPALAFDLEMIIGYWLLKIINDQ